MSDHYDVRGSGPVLLIIPGGAGHSMGLENATALLSERFTVVTYDPLGLAHGRLGEPVEEQRVEGWSDGAARVLDAVLPEGESAYVFGSSSGAVAALDLASRHPDRLRHVVAHEPPVVAVLPDAERQRSMFTEVRDAYRTQGAEAASVRMTAGMEERALTEEELNKTSDAAPQPPSPTDELATPMGVFLTRVLVPFTSYSPHLAALSAASPRLTVAVGIDSAGQLLHRTTTFLARRTGGVARPFPGGHLGLLTHPAEFAARLRETLVPVG
ncbi:alpha/beta hydrolase [Streptomyces sp. ME02-8801-2C]|uniref:alpha/beta hydrolase n=1 Tax=Streptomyces sp. ME02-8801-2C TaxID=3028680 RepID=UPI0029B704E4|nr:alpha/beta hydrolase [Streptomyces sp. ME02-8801-2C]MDX3451146.1 alpha/beta hydrolase [Streptomyces sp. ME02-8801-2C]